MGRPKLHNDALRERLLRRAGEIVSAEGIRGLSMRRIAADEQTSAGAIYALFGGKSELISALFTQSFESFGAAQSLMRKTDDARSDLIELGMGYWDWAMDNPHLIRIMFGEALAGFVPTAEEEAEALRTMEPLVGAVARCVHEGLIEGDVQLIAFSAWATVHGAVSLTLARQNAGSPAEQRDRLRVMLDHTWAGWAPRGKD